MISSQCVNYTTTTPGPHATPSESPTTTTHFSESITPSPPELDSIRLSATIWTVTIVLILVVIALLVCALTVIVTVYMKKKKRSRFDVETSQLSAGQAYRSRVTQLPSTDEPRYVDNIHTVL